MSFKKIDSLLRGNTFKEVAWLAQQGCFDRVVFAPAFPAQGRFVVEGHLHVGGPAIDVSVAVRASGGSIVDRLRAAGAVAASADPCARIWVPDLRANSDWSDVLATLDSPLGRRTLWCGSAGMAQALAGWLGVRAAAVEPVRSKSPGPGRVWVIGASHHPVTRSQWRALRAAMPQARHLQEGDEAALAGLLVALRERPDDGHPVCLELAPVERLTAGAAAERLARQCAALATLAPPATVRVVGGDTFRALCLATGAERLTTGEAALPGWGVAHLGGGRWDGVTVHSRSGAFGRPEDLSDALAHALEP